MKLSEILIMLIILMGIMTGGLNFYVDLYGHNNASTDNNITQYYDYSTQSDYMNEIATRTEGQAEQVANSSTSSPIATMTEAGGIMTGLRQVGDTILSTPNILHDMLSSIASDLGVGVAWINGVIITILFITITFAILNYLRGTDRL